MERPEIPKKIRISESSSVINTTNNQENNTYANELDEYIYKSPIDSPKLTTQQSESKLNRNNNLFNNDLYTNLKNINENKKHLSEIVDSPYFILTDMNNGLDISTNEQRPKIPPKIRLSEPPVVLSKPNLESLDYVYFDNNIIENDDNFINWDIYELERAKLTNFNDYQNEIYSCFGCNKCADCSLPNPTWISLQYLITLCSNCAKIHQKLLHPIDVIHLMPLLDVYEQKSNRLLHIIVLSLLKHTGNEKFNSLLEYERPQFDGFIEKFIVDKYSQNKFINQYDSQLSLGEINHNFFNNIQGNCISYTIYNLILGADLNYSLNDETCLDIAIRYKNELQFLYLNLVGARRYVDMIDAKDNICYQGSLLYQSFNKVVYNYEAYLNKNSITFKSMSNRTLISNKIELNSILRIISNQDECSFEILSVDNFNYSILKQKFDVSYEIERQKWVRVIIKKIMLNDNCRVDELFNSIRNDTIRIYGSLNVSFSSDDLQEAKLLLISNDNDFKINLVIITNTIGVFDLRKLTKIKLVDDKLMLTIDSRIFYLNSDGYLDNIRVWFNVIERESKIKKIMSVQTNYLNKDDIPLILEKSFFYIQINNNGLFDTSVQDISCLYDSLLKDKNYQLISNSQYRPSTILLVIKKFFMDFFEFPEKVLKILGEELNNDHLKLIKETFDKYQAESDQNKITYSIIRFVFIQYHLLQKKNIDNIDNFFKELLLPVVEIEKFYYLASNFQDIFEINDGYLAKEQNLIEKSISLKRLSGIFTQNNLSFLVTVYLESNKNDSFIQTNINTAPKVSQIINELRMKFNLEESMYLCMTEVFMDDHSFERILPVDSIFFDVTSKWSNKFHYCVKLNSVLMTLKELNLLQKDNLDIFSEKCEYCVVDNISQNQLKLKSCYVSLNKACICIYKHVPSTGLYTSKNSLEIELIVETPFIKLNIEDCLVYLGSFDDPLTKNSLIFYSLVDKKFYIIKYHTQIDAYKWYLNSFKLKHHPDSWSCFSKDVKPLVSFRNDNEDNVNVLPIRRSVSSNSMNFVDFKKQLFGIFKRIR